ncbi:MAG TPA: class I SAM-dependent methyltransferase [Usitatibacter sp.]|nr:class I SAM-dependent methyltransferase [Usitatibacter sp.]
MIRIKSQVDEMGSNWYERFILPYAIDLACGMKAVTRQRTKVVPLAKGRVLEVGIGTGLNLRHYDRARIERLAGLDPAVEMHRLARKRMLRAGLDVEMIPLPAETIPADDASFDTVVVTYTLCSIRDPAAALREMRRVLAPGGQLLFCEHGRAPEEGVRRWQARFDRYWPILAGGCHMSRDVPALLTQAGFALEDLQAGYIPGPRVLSYNYWGRALPA